MMAAKKQLSNSDLIRIRRENLLIREGYFNLFYRIVLIALAAYVLFTQVFLVMQVSGNDMFPAVKDGDLVIAYRLEKNFAKEDLVVFKQEDTRLVRRILAPGNDVVTLDDSGNVNLNGTVQGGEILYLTYAKQGIEYPLRIDADHVFVLGDHRTKAVDSRDFGPVAKSEIEGKVITILRRRGL